MAEAEITVPRKRGRPAKTGKPMSALERQKRRQALTSGLTDAVVEVMSRLVLRTGQDNADFTDNAFKYEPSISFQFSAKDILSFIPDDLHHDFWSRIQLSIAKKSFQHDLINIEERKKSWKTLPATTRFNDIFIWNLVYKTMLHRNEHDRLIKKTLEILPFLVNGMTKDHEQKYIDLYITYRGLYEAELDTYRKRKSAEINESRTCSRVDRAHLTRMEKMRKEVISYEEKTCPKRKKYDQGLDRDLFKEECIAIAYSLSDEELKARHKEIQAISRD